MKNKINSRNLKISLLFTAAGIVASAFAAMYQLDMFSDEIKKQIENLIEKKYCDFDNEKIDIDNNPILSRITYIVFPVWDLKDLAEKFQRMI